MEVLDEFTVMFFILNTDRWEKMNESGYIPLIVGAILGFLYHLQPPCKQVSNQ